MISAEGDVRLASENGKRHDKNGDLKESEIVEIRGGTSVIRKNDFLIFEKQANMRRMENY